MKDIIIFHLKTNIFYVLEQKYENNVYPCKLQFYYIKVGCKGVFITRTCFRDEITCINTCRNLICGIYTRGVPERGENSCNLITTLWILSKFTDNC